MFNSEFQNPYAYNIKTPSNHYDNAIKTPKNGQQKKIYKQNFFGIIIIDKWRQRTAESSQSIPVRPINAGVICRRDGNGK